MNRLMLHSASTGLATFPLSDNTIEGKELPMSVPQRIGSEEEEEVMEIAEASVK